jgi:tetratricopeptide (TPR) repeat protein
VHFLLRPIGRITEALVEINEGLAADPLSPWVRWSRACMLYFNRQFGEAREQCRRTLDIEPNYHFAYWTLGQAYEAEERFDEAIEAYEKSISLSTRGAAQLSSLGAVYAKAGRRDEAEAILRELEQREQINYVPASAFAFVCFALGRNDEGFSWLERAVDKHEPAILTLNTHPSGDSIRGDARYQKLIERLRLPQRDLSRFCS